MAVMKATWAIDLLEVLRSSPLSLHGGDNPACTHVHDTDLQWVNTPGWATERGRSKDMPPELVKGHEAF